MSTSIFSTKDTNSDDVGFLVDNCDTLAPEGVFQPSALPEDFPIKYSRAWLIVRRAWIEANAKNLLVNVTKKQVDAAQKKYGDQYDEKRHVWGPIVENLRDSEKLSWGEIAVRCGMAESKVRASYRALGAKKDIGLRIGKGGKFAYGDPELYLEHRQVEGAMIPADYKGKPKPEDLLNAKNADGKVVKAKRAASAA